MATPEDVVTNVPAAPIETLGYGMEHQGVSRVQQLVIRRKLEFRRTTIPIFLTTGLLLLLIPALRFVVDPESGLATVMTAMWIPIVLALVGLAMLACGVMTMLSVKGQLEALAAETAPKPSA